MVLGSAVFAIKNGQPDRDAHPYVCWILTWDGVSQYVYLGSGSLISPTVVLTAGHITADPSIAFVWVSFASEFDPATDWPPFNPLATVWHEVADWYTHPDYGIGGEKGLTDWITHDVGILILDEPVLLDTYPTLAFVGQVDTLSMKEDVDLVGYGVQYQRRGLGVPPPGNWDYIAFGYRYSAQAQIITSTHVMSDEFMRLTANPGQGKGGTCFGDSGGPVLLAGTDTILGVCSWGTNGNCAGVSYHQRIDTLAIQDWINTFLP
jgi:hypothetical protein